MSEISKIIQKLAKNGKQTGSKIIKIKEHLNTGISNYIDPNGQIVIDGEPIDGTPDITGIKLNPDPNNSTYSIPEVGSYGIVIFTNNYDAYLITSTATTLVKQKIVVENGQITVYEVLNENDNSVFKLETDQVNVTTHNGGVFNITDNVVMMSNANRIRFQINNDVGSILSEIIIDTNEGINIISYNNTPITIKNNTISLKELLNDLIDKFASATYISPVGTATVSPTSQAELLAYKAQIATLLN